MIMDLVWNIVFLIICHINFLLHLLGFYLLVKLYRKNKHTVQRLCLINLSLRDALKNFLFIPYICMEMEGMKETTIQKYMDICFLTIIPCLYYSLIILITIDRFLAVCLHVKYRAYVTPGRAKYCLMLIWVCSFLLGAVLSVLYHFKHITLDFYPYNMYIYLTLDVLFIVVALGTYCFIFSRYHSLAKETQQSCSFRNRNEEERTNLSAFHRFRHSKFYTSAIIVSNFMLLIAIPDIVFTAYLHISTSPPPFVAIVVLTLMNLLSDLCDFVIYVFIQKQVRDLLLKKIFACVKRRPPRKSLLLQREQALKRSVGYSIHDRTATTSSDVSCTNF